MTTQENLIDISMISQKENHSKSTQKEILNISSINVSMISREKRQLFVFKKRVLEFIEDKEASNSKSIESRRKRKRSNQDVNSECECSSISKK